MSGAVKLAIVAGIVETTNPTTGTQPELSNSPTTSTSLAFCTACGASLAATPAARFCGMCGTALTPDALQFAHSYGQRSALKPAQIAKIVFGALVIFIPVTFYTTWKTGKVPTETITVGAGGPKSSNSADAPFEIPEKYKAVQEAAFKTPSDIRLQNEYAAVLITLIREANEEPSQALVLEAVEQLSRILAINPLEPDALLSLADISFNQQIFNKAAELYQRFLALRPDDEDVRARYGSALMFQGEFDKSIEQQNAVLKKNPNNFQAAAYLAVAYGQKGNIAEARSAAARALKLAPNEEAKKRLEAFLTSLDKKPVGVAATEAQPRQETGAVVPSDKATAVSALEAALRENPVAGRKFGGLTITGSVATATMIDFPMQAMPPFAKDKFYGSLAAAVKADNLKTVIFVDQATGQEIERKEF